MPDGSMAGLLHAKDTRKILKLFLRYMPQPIAFIGKAFYKVT